MLCEDHSDYRVVYYYPDKGAENAANSIIKRCSIFGVSKMLMSNGPTNSKNVTLRLVSKCFKILRYFTLAYYPWSNDAVEG